jgi:hypothetical protein
MFRVAKAAILPELYLPWLETFTSQNVPNMPFSCPLVEATFMRIPLSLLLVQEVGGRAIPICRVRAPGLVNRVRNAAVQEKLAEAETATDPFTQRRARMEAELIQSAK